MTILDHIASRQHGLVTNVQLTEAGVPVGTITAWRRSGRLIAVQPRVDRLAGAPTTFEQRVLAAVLSAGPRAAASHRTAARLWGVLDTGEAEIVVPKGRSARLWGDVVVHHTRDDIPATPRRGIPVTTPMRTVVDVGAVCPDQVVEDVLDRILVARLCSMAAVEWELTRIARRGRIGVGPLRRVLDDRALGRDRPDGLLEPRFARLVRDGNLPQPVFQLEVDGFRIDFSYPEILLAIEVDGYAVHGTRRAFQEDRERQNRLVALGWTVLRFTWEDVVRRPEKVAAVIRAAIDRAHRGMSR